MGTVIIGMSSARAETAAARTMLALGALAGPLYILIAAVQVLTRDGFDARRHSVSMLANGDLGWVQVANFVLCGALVVAGAWGARRMLRTGPSRVWGPWLLGVYGASLIAAGFFPADAAMGFPPGTPADAMTITTNGMLHFVCGAVGFFALIVATFLFARRFARHAQRGWGVYSIATGMLFLVTFVGIATGAGSPVLVLGFYFGVAWVWIWHCLLMMKLRREPPVTAGVLREHVPIGRGSAARRG